MRLVSVIALAVVLIVAGPLVSLWSLNTLFGLGIGYTVWTWLAMFWVGCCLFPNKFK